VRDAAALPLGVMSSILGLLAGTVAFAFAWMAAAWCLHLYRGSGENSLVDACFQLVALLVVSHGLAPDASWNHVPFMLAAIAGSWRVYILPFSAVALGLLGLLLARRSRTSASRISLAAAAVRFSKNGAALGGFAVAVLLGWLVIHWAVWG
jgi:hypothetical protein